MNKRLTAAIKMQFSAVMLRYRSANDAAARRTAGT
jgi:hypothetical protein